MCSHEGVSEPLRQHKSDKPDTDLNKPGQDHYQAAQCTLHQENRSFDKHRKKSNIPPPYICHILIIIYCGWGSRVLRWEEQEHKIVVSLLALTSECWSAPGGGWNMEMSPGDQRLYCVDYCWWPGAGLGLSTIEICTHQDVRCEAHGCLSLLSEVQSSVGGEIKHWLRVFEQPWAQVEECWIYQLIHSQSHGPMNIRICIGDKTLRQNISKDCTC